MKDQEIDCDNGLTTESVAIVTPPAVSMPSVSCLHVRLFLHSVAVSIFFALVYAHWSYLSTTIMIHQIVKIIIKKFNMSSGSGHNHIAYNKFLKKANEGGQRRIGAYFGEQQSMLTFIVSEKWECDLEWWPRSPRHCRFTPHPPPKCHGCCAAGYQWSPTTRSFFTSLLAAVGVFFGIIVICVHLQAEPTQLRGPSAKPTNIRIVPPRVRNWGMSRHFFTLSFALATTSALPHPTLPMANLPHHLSNLLLSTCLLLCDALRFRFQLRENSINRNLQGHLERSPKPRRLKQSKCPQTHRRWCCQPHCLKMPNSVICLINSIRRLMHICC